MGVVFEDTYGHQTKYGSQGAALAAGAVGVVTAGTVAGTASAGAAPTVAGVNATDAAGNFTLNPVTGGGAQAAGVVATVRFAQPYPAIPRAVLVTVTQGNTVVAAGAVNLSVGGFDVATTILTTGLAYAVQYVVIP